MQITGIESVEFGAPDMAEARTLFSDWGLRKAAAGGAGSGFAALNGARVVVRPEQSRLLAPRVGKSNFREVIFGVRSKRDLAEIGEELSRDRSVSVAADGSLHTHDDADVNIGFRIWTPRAGVAERVTRFNQPGRRDRLDRIGTVYTQAQPFQMGHIVFFVPDTRAAENFYRKRLGWWVSDRYAGEVGVFLRWAAKSEHHNMFLLKSRSGSTELHHIAFEVNDVHEVFGGGMTYADKGHVTDTGPGRHPISSAYFWYFKNPLGGSIEYFADPDWVTEKGWKPHNYTVNRFSEWHLPDGLPENDGTPGGSTGKPAGKPSGKPGGKPVRKALKAADKLERPVPMPGKRKARA